MAITYIPTLEMVADGLTKPLERIKFEEFKRMMGLVSGGATKRARLE
jgi:hypothetical protein